MAVFLLELQVLSTLALLLVPLLVLLSLRSLQQSKNKKKQQYYNLPPGPKPLPIIGNLHQVGQLPHSSLARLAREHGPLMYIRLGQVPAVVVSNAAMAAEMVRTHDHAFCDRPTSVGLTKFSYGGLDIAGANYNETWRVGKKVAVLELFTAKRVQSFRPVREEEIGFLVTTVAREASAAPGNLVNLSELATSLYMNIICREVFGRRISDEEGVCGSGGYQHLISEMLYLLGGFCAGDFFPGMEWLNNLTGWQAKLEKNFSEIDAFLEEEIEASQKRKAESGTEGDDSDFCSILLRLQKEESLTIPLTKTQIKAILMNMFFGGSDTSASALKWTIAELVRHPDAMKKAQEEVRRVVGNKGKVDEDDVQHLHYLKLVMKEAFRMHPFGLLPRKCREDTKINGYDIPAKMTVYVNTYAITRDPEYWVDPERFWPERFEDSPIDYKGQHFQFLPFGSGRRMCPGMSLARHGLELAVANLLYSFQWDMPDGQDDLDMSEAFGVDIQMKAPLILKAIPVITK